MAKTIDVSKLGNTLDISNTNSKGGRGGKIGSYGSVVEAVCAFIECLLAVKVALQDGTEGTKLDTIRESEFSAWKKAVWPSNTPTQKLRVYLGHYNRLTCGYGPLAAYTAGKRSEKSLKADHAKYANKAPSRTNVVQDLPAKAGA
jgi:hypothetical protein